MTPARTIFSAIVNFFHCSLCFGLSEASCHPFHSGEDHGLTGQDSGCALSANQEFSSRLQQFTRPAKIRCWLIRLKTALFLPVTITLNEKDRTMNLFTNTQRQQLLKNGNAKNRGKDHKPVVKLVLPGSHLIILLTEIDSEDPYLAFGLCDLGMGFPELGYVDLNELSELRSHDNYQVECDQSFEATQPLSVYTSAARHFQTITTDAEELAAQGSFFFLWQDYS